MIRQVDPSNSIDEAKIRQHIVTVRAGQYRNAGIRIRQARDGPEGTRLGGAFTGDAGHTGHKKGQHCDPICGDGQPKPLGHPVDEGRPLTSTNGRTQARLQFVGIAHRRWCRQMSLHPRQKPTLTLT